MYLCVSKVIPECLLMLMTEQLWAPVLAHSKSMPVSGLFIPSMIFTTSQLSCVHNTELENDMVLCGINAHCGAPNGPKEPVKRRENKKKKK